MLNSKQHILITFDLKKMQSKHLFKANLKWESEGQMVKATPARYLKTIRFLLRVKSS
jgi:hypothetical protein